MCVCITAMGFNKRRRGIYYIQFGNLLRPLNMFKPRRGKRDMFYIDHGAPTTHNHERPQLRHQNRPSDSYGPSMRKPLALGHRGSAPDPSAKGLCGAACPVQLKEKEKLLIHEGQATEVTGP